jgi:hypothetical protein
MMAGMEKRALITVRSFGLLYLTGALALYGCSQSAQMPAGAPGVLHGSGRAGSNSSGDLLYASNGSVQIYTYPAGKLQAIFSVPGTYVSATGLCADEKGNVFVPAATGASINAGYIFEYAHGGTQPIATLNDGYWSPGSCTVDPVTGNLAVTNVFFGSAAPARGTAHTGGPLTSAGDVAIYADAKGSPTEYTDSNVTNYGTAAYDDNGNLFVLGYNDPKNEQYLLELAKGAKTFEPISLSGVLTDAGRMQWAGGYLTVLTARRDDRNPAITQLSVRGSSATIVGRTEVGDRYSYGVGDFIDGNRIIMTDGVGRSSCSLGIFRYPAGGKAEKIVNTRNLCDENIVVSSAPSL